MGKFDWKLFLITLILGWFGVDKLYKGDKKMALYKLIATILVVGVLWNLYDLVLSVVGTYKPHPFAKA